MKEKLWNSKYIVLLLADILTCFSFYMITTILTSYLVDIGSDLSVAGTIVGLFSITSLVMRPVTGYASDNYNKRMILIVGMFVVAVAIFGYVNTAQLPVIVVLRILHGVAFALISTAVVSLASEFIPKSRLNEGIGYLGLAQIIPSAVGPGVGAWIMNQYGIRWSFIVASLFSLLGMVLMVLFRYQYTPRKTKFAFKLDQVLCLDAANHAAISGLYSFSNGVISSFIVLFALTKGIADVSVYFTVCAVFLFAVRPMIARIVDKVDMKYIVYPGLCLSLISMILLANADTLAMILLSAVIRSIAQGAVQPVLQAECIRCAGEGKSGVATSTYYLACDVGQGVGPMVAGFIAGAMGYASVFYLCAFMFVIAGFIFAAGRKKHG